MLVFFEPNLQNASLFSRKADEASTDQGLGNIWASWEKEKKEARDADSKEAFN